MRDLSFAITRIVQSIIFALVENAYIELLVGLGCTHHLASRVDLLDKPDRKRHIRLY